VGIFGRLTPFVKTLIIVNVSVFFLNSSFLLDGKLTELLGLNPSRAIYGLQVWQFVTYMFVHANYVHLLFNMLALWMFGGPVEEAMGSRKFINYYFLTGLGAAFFVCVFFPNSVTIGASGAIYGLLAAFGMIFPDAVVLVFFLFPMRAKYFVLLFAAIELYATIANNGGESDSIAYFAHIGGFVTGYLYLKYHYKIEEMYSMAGRYKAVKNYHQETGIKSEQEIQDQVLQDRVLQDRVLQDRVLQDRVLQDRVLQDRTLQEHVDIILDKIRESGIESLSKEEYEMLNRASERLREKEEKVVDLNQYRERNR